MANRLTVTWVSTSSKNGKKIQKGTREKLKLVFDYLEKYLL